MRRMSAATQFTGCPMPENRPLQHHKVSVGDDRSVFIPERRRDALDESEETLPARPDMGAVLDIVRRPKLLRRVLVTFVEQRVGGLQNEPLVLLTGIIHLRILLLN